MDYSVFKGQRARPGHQEYSGLRRSPPPHKSPLTLNASAVQVLGHVTPESARNGCGRSTSISSESTKKSGADLQVNSGQDLTKDLPANPPKKGVERLRAKDEAFARMLNVINQFEKTKNQGNSCGPGFNRQSRRYSISCPRSGGNTRNRSASYNQGPELMVAGHFQGNGQPSQGYNTNSKRYYTAQPPGQSQGRHDRLSEQERSRSRGVQDQTSLESMSKTNRAQAKLSQIRDNSKSELAHPSRFDQVQGNSQLLDSEKQEHTSVVLGLVKPDTVVEAKPCRNLIIPDTAQTKIVQEQSDKKCFKTKAVNVDAEKSEPKPEQQQIALHDQSKQKDSCSKEGIILQKLDRAQQVKAVHETEKENTIQENVSVSASRMPNVKQNASKMPLFFLNNPNISPDLPIRPRNLPNVPNIPQKLPSISSNCPDRKVIPNRSEPATPFQGLEKNLQPVKQILKQDLLKEEPKCQNGVDEKSVALRSTASFPGTNHKPPVQTLKSYNTNVAKHPPVINSVGQHHINDAKSTLPTEINSMNHVTLTKLINNDLSSDPDLKNSVSRKVEQGFSVEAYVREIMSPIVVTRVTLHPDDVQVKKFPRDLCKDIRVDRAVLESRNQVKNLPSNVRSQVLNSIILDISTPDKEEQLSAVPCLKPISNHEHVVHKAVPKMAPQISSSENETRQSCTSEMESDNLIFLGTEINSTDIPQHVVQRAVRHVSESETVAAQPDGNNNEFKQSGYKNASPINDLSSDDEHFAAPLDVAQRNHNLNPSDALVSNIFDSHCHLDRIYSYWKHAKVSDPLANLTRKFPKVFGPKFEGCIAVNCDPRNWKSEHWEWQSGESNVWLTFGCHPNLAHYYNEATEELLWKCLLFSKAVAVGETGLDSMCPVPRKVQEKVFKRQLEVAKATKLPVCLHIRGVPELASIANKILHEVLPADWPIHHHCFSDSWMTASKWMAEWPNMKFGVVPNKFQPDFINRLPLDRLLLETDSPYLIPHVVKHKYKFSMPGFVYHTAVQVAEAKNLPVAKVLQASRANVELIYGIRFGPEGDDEQQSDPDLNDMVVACNGPIQ